VAINNPAWLNRPEIIGSLFDKMSLDRAISGADSAAYSLLNFPAADGVELTARIFEGSGDGPVILYFPAEYETIETLLILGEGFKIIGFNMISLDYRGLGLSKGSGRGNLFIMVNISIMTGRLSAVAAILRAFTGPCINNRTEIKMTPVDSATEIIGSPA